MKNLPLIFFLAAGMQCFSQAAHAQFDSAYVYTYGGTNDDYARQIICTSDSGYIVVGTTSSFGVATTDIYLVKTDKNAVRQWSHLYGSPSIEWGYSVRQTPDNGYIIAGYTNQNSSTGYDIYLLKVDENGAEEWTKTIGGTDWDFGYALELTADGGYIICGKSFSYSSGGADVFIVKTNATGDLQWQKNYGGTGNESANAIIRDRNNDYAIVGETESYGAGEGDMWVLKINGSGDTLWTRTLGTTKWDAGYAVDTALDGNYLMVGSTLGSPVDTTSNIYFVKTESTSGSTMWEHMQGENGSNDEEGRVVKQLPDGDIMSGGMTLSYGLGGKAYFMLRNNSNGIYITGASFGGSDDDEGYSVAVGKDYQIVFAGISDSYGCGLNDMYLARIDTFPFVNEYFVGIIPFCDSTIGITEFNPINNNIAFYPNPVTSMCRVSYMNADNGKNYTVAITGLLGNEVIRFDVSRFPFEFSVAGTISNGAYLVSIFKDGMLEGSNKLIVF
jgi:hypothetical protein